MHRSKSLLAAMVATSAIAAMSSTATAEAQTRRSAARPSWIIGPWYATSGGWSATRPTCVLNGVSFRNGGRYDAVNESGRWSLAGNVLTLVATHETDGESDTALRQPRRVTVRVSPLPNGRMNWQVGNSPARVMLRCPTAW